MNSRLGTGVLGAVLGAIVAVAVMLALDVGGGDESAEPVASESEEIAEVGTGSADSGSDAPQPVSDGEAEASSLLVIMDASGSMKQRLDDGRSRIAAAKQALRELAAGLPEGTEVGLRVFGNAARNGCQNTDLVSPVEPLDRERMSAAVGGLRAKGKTPIGLSLRQAGADLPEEGERAIVLVSDGKDSCAPPDPCDVAKELQGQGIEVRIDTVGFALGDDEGARRQLQCIAEAGGGNFHDVSDADELSETLSEVAGEATREARTVDVEGDPVECGPTPSQAPIVEPGGTYQDTILPSETLYCGFEVGGLEGISAQVTFFPGAQSNCGRLDLHLVDEATGSLTDLDLASSSAGGQPQLDCETDSPGIAEPKARLPEDLDNAYLELSVNCGFAYQNDVDECESGEYPVQFTFEQAEAE